MLIKVLCVIIAVLLPVDLAAPSDFYLDPVWITGPETLIGQRFYHTLVQDSKGDIWTFAGQNIGYQELDNDVWKLEVNNNFTWVRVTTTGPAPSPRGGYQMWIVDDIIYVHGGEAKDYNPVYGDFYSFDTTALEWSLIGDYGDGNPGDLRVGNSSTFPGGRTDAAVWADSATKTLWMAHGGTATENLGDTWCYNITSNIWTWVSGSIGQSDGSMGDIGDFSITFNPRSIWFPQAAVDRNGDVWLWSGLVSYGPDYVATNELWRFRPSTYEWAYMGGSLDARAPVYGPPGQCGASVWPAGTYAGMLVYSGADILTYYGGERAANKSYNFALDQVWSYNITLQQWAFISGTQEEVEVMQEYDAFQESSPTNNTGLRLESAVQTMRGNLWLHGGSQSSSDTPVTAMFVLPVNLCVTELTPCNANADCMPNEWTVTCVCRPGYTGSGVVADGCTMLEVPQVQQPLTQGQPQSKTPTGKTSPGSAARSRSHFQRRRCNIDLNVRLGSTIV